MQQKLEEGDEDWISLAWLYREAIPYFIEEEYDCGPFPLCHPDFSNANFIYDLNNNLSGIIDWTAAQTVPWEKFARFPHDFNRRLGPDNQISTSARKLFLDILEEEERRVDDIAPMVKFMRSGKGRMAELVDQYHWGGRLPIEDITELINLMYGSQRTWEDVKNLAIKSLRGDRLIHSTLLFPKTDGLI